MQTKTTVWDSEVRIHHDIYEDMNFTLLELSKEMNISKGDVIKTLIEQSVIYQEKYKILQKEVFDV